jgi:hypothetical protein
MAISAPPALASNRTPLAHSQALTTFRFFVTELWRRTLRRRSQTDGMSWERIRRLATMGRLGTGIVTVAGENDGEEIAMLWSLISAPP